jgi:cyclophilin family peptidyl-prolyl cis-trans isomerase
MRGMPRRCLSIAATWVVAACPGPARPAQPPEVAPADTALRIRIAQAEARRAGGVAELEQLARHGGKPERLLALRGLGRIGAVGAVGAGAPAADGAMHPPATPPVEALIAALGDPDPDVVGAAAAAIGVAAALDDDRDLGASDALVAALPRGGGPVVEALGRAGTAAVQPVLVAALGDPRLAALAGLALGGHGRRKIALAEPSRQALIAATSAADPAVRYAAVHALAREHQPPEHPASVAALVGRLGDPVAEIRAQAIAGLGRRKAGAAAGAAGAKLLLDRDWRVAAEAVRALADSDDGKDAIAAAIVRRFDELERSETRRGIERGETGDGAAQVILEGERALAGAAGRPLVASALSSLASRAQGAPALPALTRGWISCLAIAAIERARPDPDLDAIARCELPDPLRLPLVADLIAAGAGPLAARRAALVRLTTHADPRVRAAGLGALVALWKAGDATDHASAIATLIAALGSRDLNVAGAAVDAATAIHDAAGGGDRAELAPLDAALIARTRAERDPELGAALLQLIGKRRLAGGLDACRGALDADPVRAKAAIGCLDALGEPRTWAPPAATPPPVDISAVIGKVLRWRLTTTRGDVVIALHPEVAPWAVAAIVALTRRGFYDGVAFHRVVPDFVVQGGDPTESGSGGPGFALPAEPATLLDGAGYLAGGVGIADAGRDSGGSQWFVMHSRAPHLDGRYTWIGAVESGQKSADALLIGDRVVHAVIESAP